MRHIHRCRFQKNKVYRIFRDYLLFSKCVFIVELNIFYSNIENVSTKILTLAQKKRENNWRICMEVESMQENQAKYFIFCDNSIYGRTKINWYNGYYFRFFDGSSKCVVAKYITDIADLQHRGRYAMLFLMWNMEKILYNLWIEMEWDMFNWKGSISHLEFR